MGRAFKYVKETTGVPGPGAYGEFAPARCGYPAMARMPSCCVCDGNTAIHGVIFVVYDLPHAAHALLRTPADVHNVPVSKVKYNSPDAGTKFGTSVRPMLATVKF